MEISEDELQDLYTWVDEIPLSRPKRNIARDFSDAVLAAEVVYHFFPKEVQLHNYSAANSYAQKMYNWNTLNAKVCSKLGFVMPKLDCEAAAKAQPMAVERILNLFRYKFAELAKAGQITPTSPKSQSKPTEYATYKVASEEQQAPMPTSAGSLNTQPARPRAAPAEDVHNSQEVVRELREMNEELDWVAPGHWQRRTSRAIVHLVRLEPTVQISVAQWLAILCQILETKTRKLEQLVRLKDAKIQTLLAKMETAGIQ